MYPVLKTTVVVLLTTLSLSQFITGCSGTPQPQVAQDIPAASADSQRSNAKQAQDELSRETAGEK